MKAAIVYARQGFAVLPVHDVSSSSCSCGEPSCRSPGKHPRISAWETKATAELGQVSAWVSKFPTANIGLATGEKSGFFVLDVDVDSGGDASLAELVELHGELPKTALAQTGSGGFHYLFKLPGFSVANSAGKIGRGLDIRGDGGQIVVAPSRSAKGPYRWIRAPWDVEISEAPEWLLELLQAPAVKPGSAPTPVEERGYFPPASRATLKAARAALDAHGPAIEGKGGDEHTFRAAAKLRRDFALTFEEAWPLFTEWNESCEPPWDETELAAKLHGGERYGSAEFGSHREHDALEAVKKLIGDWRDRGAHDAELPDLVIACRPWAERSGDPTRHQLIENELKALTGFKTKSLDLPPPRPPREATPAGTIEVTPRLHEVANESTRAIAPKVFVRSGVLCEVAKQPDGKTFIVDLAAARIQDLMSQCATFARNGDKGMTKQAPPMPVAAILHARRAHAGVRLIEAVTTAPVFLADGTILQERGYNAQARVFLEPSVSVEVMDNPEPEDAVAAVDAFRELLCDFRFLEPGDFSSWLAALLTPLVKASLSNAPSPLFCISASSAGAGKTLLVNIIARIITGSPAEIRPYNPRDPGEWGKRLTAFVKAASPVSVFDNVNGVFGDEGIDRLVTSSTWSDRILGASDAPPLPNVSTWIATGNNIEPVGDTVRRSLFVRLDVDTERPQERSGFLHEDIESYVLAHRAKYLSHALTILRGFHVAGRPDAKLPTWGSFTEWSRLVRSALVWAGCVDPFVTQRRAELLCNEEDAEAHDFWLGVLSESADGTPATIAATANSRGARDVLGLREEITTFTLKRFVGRFVDKPRAGKRIRRVVGPPLSYEIEDIIP